MDLETGRATLPAPRTGSRLSRLASTAGPVALGALLVAVAAQVVVPLPFTPVPMTLQPLAVLVVGGLLGAAAGGSALILYIALGALGLPVFAAGGSGGLHLIGPTGGGLLALPGGGPVVRGFGSAPASPPGGGRGYRSFGASRAFLSVAGAPRLCHRHGHHPCRRSRSACLARRKPWNGVPRGLCSLPDWRSPEGRVGGGNHFGRRTQASPA